MNLDLFSLGLYFCFPDQTKIDTTMAEGEN